MWNKPENMTVLKEELVVLATVEADAELAWGLYVHFSGT